MNYSYGAAFLEAFDAYASARARLKAAEDGSDEERLCINNCVDQWNRAVAARDALDATKSEGQK